MSQQECKSTLKATEASISDIVQHLKDLSTSMIMLKEELILETFCKIFGNEPLLRRTFF